MHVSEFQCFCCFSYFAIIAPNIVNVREIRQKDALQFSKEMKRHQTVQDLDVVYQCVREQMKPLEKGRDCVLLLLISSIGPKNDGAAIDLLVLFHFRVFSCALINPSSSSLILASACYGSPGREVGVNM